MAMARWDLPVPVPPTSTTLRWSAMNVPPSSSRSSASLIGVPVKSKSSMSLASGSLASVIWYLIERASFSAISADRRSPTIFGGACERPTRCTNPIPARPIPTARLEASRLTPAMSGLAPAVR